MRYQTKYLTFIEFIMFIAAFMYVAMSNAIGTSENVPMLFLSAMIVWRTLNLLKKRFKFNHRRVKVRR